MTDISGEQWNTLLYWMSSVGRGSWDRFRNVVRQLATQDGDLGQLRRTLRVRLSDFGYVNFFIGDSSRWEALPPLLAGLVASRNTALLTGARTPKLLARVQGVAARHEVELFSECWPDSPGVVRLKGTPAAMAACAMEAGIDYADSYAWRLAAKLVPIPTLLDRPRRETDRAPVNWVPRSFDLQSREWVDDALPNAACEFTPRYGRPRYFVSNRRRRLFEIAGRREAVYAAAHAQGIVLAAYDSTTNALSVPLSAPLPEAYARVACLCSGQRADVGQGRIVYPGVHPDVGAVVLTALGQPRVIVARPKGTEER